MKNNSHNSNSMTYFGISKIHDKIFWKGVDYFTNFWNELLYSTGHFIKRKISSSYKPQTNNDLREWGRKKYIFMNYTRSVTH